MSRNLKDAPPHENPERYWGSVCKRGHVAKNGYSERYLNGACIECQHLLYILNPEKARAHNRKKMGMLNDDGKSGEGEMCAICQVLLVAGRGKHSANRDHNHETGLVRDWLCGGNGCNNGISCFNEDPNLLRRAAAYLEHHAGKNQLFNIKSLKKKAS